MGVVSISPGFAYFTPWLERPTLPLVALMMIAGAGYLLALFSRKREWAKQSRSGVFFWFAIAVGLLVRLVFFGTTPIFEDDFYRYLWDGAVVAEGNNPYLHAPAEAIQNPIFSAPDPELQALADRSGDVISRVPYPLVKTIYPPVAQVAFATAHMFAPWSLTGWRLVLLLADLATLVLILSLLRHFGKSPWWVLVFWWNPLAITEVANAGHMDALLLPTITGTLLAAVSGRTKTSAVALALGVGIKFWPVLLAPILFRYFKQKNTKTAPAFIVFTALAAAFVAPQILSGLGGSDGLSTYSEGWQTNAFLFGVILDGWRAVAPAGTALLPDPGLLARLSVAALLIAKVVVLCRRGETDDMTLVTALLTITAMLFVLSPTGYPWYFLWLLPFLCIRPDPALLVLTVTLPLYDLRYPMMASGNDYQFDTLVVPLQFLPTCLWLVWRSFKQRRTETCA